MMKERTIASLAMLAILATGGLFSGCSDDATESGGNLKEFASAIPMGSAVIKDSPRAMSADSDLVVEGTVAGFTAGPIYYGHSLSDPEAVGSTMMEVSVRELIQGELPDGANETVWVEFFGLSTATADRYGPVNAEVLLYLIKMPLSGSVAPGVPVSDRDAGRPADQPTYVNWAQGMLLEEDGAVVMPLMDTSYPNATLDEFRPSEDAYPTPSKPLL